MSEILDAYENHSVHLLTKTGRNAYETDKQLCRGAFVMLELGTRSLPSDISPCACEV